MGIAPPSRPLRAAVLDRLHPTVDFDAYVFVLTDPRTSVGVDPLADVPLLDQLPRVIRLKYATAVNRWTALGDPPVARLGDRPGLPWADLLRSAGIVDVASVVF